MSSTKIPATGTEMAPPVAGPATAAPAIPGLGRIRLSPAALLSTLPIYLGLIAIWLYFNTQTAGKFIGARNLSEMLQEYSYKPVLALGVVLVLVLGEIDLSLGYLTLLSVTLTGQFSQISHWAAAPAIIAAVGICTLLGLAQGALIAWVRMPAFVVTLGGFLIFEGIAYHIVGGGTINVFDPFIGNLNNFIPPNVGWGLTIAAAAVLVLYRVAARRNRLAAGLAAGPAAGFIVSTALIVAALLGATALLNSYRGVPLATMLLVALTVVFWFVTIRLRYGRYIYSVGGNQEASRRAGINTTAIRWSVFGISGLMAGIAGVLLVGQTQAASTTTAGPDLLLDVISIAVIGGVSLTGGKGSVWAVLLGGLVIASVDSGLNLMTVDPNYVYVIKGSILLLAILIDVVGKRQGGASGRR